MKAAWPAAMVPAPRELVQEGKDVYKSGRVNQRPCLAFQLSVVALTLREQLLRVICVPRNWISCLPGPSALCSLAPLCMSNF